MEPALSHTQSRSVLENRERFFARIERLWSPDSSSFQLIERAYDTAKEALRGIEREEGVRYFEHARGVALVLLDRLCTNDAIAVALALLHDVVEENPNEWDVERIQSEFGDIIAHEVHMLTKPRSIWELTEWGLLYHASFWYAPRRVVTVKLADRYHNLTTLHYCSLAKQLRKREETRIHYLPLARYWNVLAREIEALLDEPPELRLEGIP
jgi:GTP pyrophosphokinase